MSKARYLGLKRAADLLVGGAVTLVALPVAAGVALAMKVTDPGPVFYRQLRIGKNGVPFAMYKFRTMRPGGKGGEGIDTSTWTDGVPDDFMFKTSGDAASRITPIGKFLRKTSLDELPQLLNIVNGTMSLVGPRPEIAPIVEKYNAEQRRRLDVTPGLTGWAQISGRGEQPHGDKIRADLFYVENASLSLDAKILWKTVGVVAGGKGAS